MQGEVTEQAIRKPSKIPATYRRGLILSVLFFIPAFLAFRPAAIIDPDIYWHLRTGDWILEHHSVPITDPFSTEHAPWIAYSWLFDLMVAGFFKAWGLAGLIGFTIALSMLLALATWALIRFFQPDFVKSTVLTIMALIAMAHLYTPRPWVFSILLFASHLYVVLASRDDGHWSRLRWLPVLYLLIANIHVQFVYSLLVLGLAAVLCTAEVLSNGRLQSSFPNARQAARSLWMTVGTCVLVTLVNPYGWRLYRQIFLYAFGKVEFRYLQELQAMSFRNPMDYLVLAFALLAGYYLGKRKALDLFLALLLVLSCYFGFRSLRDVWMVVLVCSVIIGRNSATCRPPSQKLSRMQIFAAVLASLFFLAITPRPGDLAKPLAEVQAAALPSKAARVIRQQNLRGPMFNYFDWGGYLIHALPEIPVQMDGRTNVHSQDRIERSLKTWNLRGEWQSDPDLVAARLVLGPKDLPLSQYLLSDPRFKLVYHDDVAYVFTRR